MGTRNNTGFYNKGPFNKFEYPSKLRPPYNNSTKFKPEELLNKTTINYQYSSIPKQPKCLREDKINKLLCQVITELEQKKGRKLTDDEMLTEIDLAQVERLVDYEYNENAKINRIRIQSEGSENSKRSFDVDKIIKDAGLLV